VLGSLNGSGAQAQPTARAATQGVPAEIVSPSSLSNEIDRLQGGDVCATATVINELPFVATGSTVGYGDDYDATCPHYAPGAPDVVYLFRPITDVQVNISLCNPGTDFDTKLYVYRDACLGAPLACNDDDCPGNRSRLVNLPLTAGVDYFIVIDGYGGGAGNYELTVDVSPSAAPACPTGASFSQAPNTSGSAGISELGAGYRRYDNFTLPSPAEPIGGLRFWALSLVFVQGVWQECAENPTSLRISFHANAANNLPGPAQCSYDLAVSASNTGLLYNGSYTLYQYDIELPATCDLASGWVSIQGLVEPCWLLWVAAPGLDNRSLVDDGSGPRPANYDLSVCLLPGGATICRGDLDCNGQVSFGDINAFVLALSDWNTWKQRYPDCPERNADINGDGQYGGTNGFGDINPFVILLASNPLPIPCPTD